MRRAPAKNAGWCVSPPLTRRGAGEGGGVVCLPSSHEEGCRRRRRGGVSPLLSRGGVPAKEAGWCVSPPLTRRGAGEGGGVVWFGELLCFVRGPQSGQENELGESRIHRRGQHGAGE